MYCGHMEIRIRPLTNGEASSTPLKAICNCIKCAFWLIYYLLKIVMKIENRAISQQVNGSFYSKTFNQVALRLVSQIKQVS